MRTTFDSVAVLPFVNGTGNPDNDYLTDGITDRLINGLAQVSSLRVVPRSLVYSYQDKNVDPLELGQQLEVAAMVTGRISQRQNRLTLAVELSDAREVAQVWGRQYESSLDDLLNLQDSISTEIVKQLRVGVSEEDDQRLRRRYTENIESYHLYLKGLYYLNKQTPDGIRRSSEFFKRAIDLDPGNALGYAGLADSFSWSGYLGIDAARRGLSAVPEQLLNGRWRSIPISERRLRLAGASSCSMTGISLERRPISVALWSFRPILHERIRVMAPI